MLEVLIILVYIIIAVLAIMGQIWYITNKEGDSVDLSGEDSYVYIVGLVWPMAAIIAIVYLIVHVIGMFFQWFADSIKKGE